MARGKPEYRKALYNQKRLSRAIQLGLDLSEGMREASLDHPDVVDFAQRSMEAEVGDDWKEDTGIGFRQTLQHGPEAGVLSEDRRSIVPHVTGFGRSAKPSARDFGPDL